MVLNNLLYVLPDDSERSVESTIDIKMKQTKKIYRAFVHGSNMDEIKREWRNCKWYTFKCREV